MGNGISSLCCKDVIHVQPVSPVDPLHPSFNVLSSKLPCLNLEEAKDSSISIGEAGPLVVGPFGVEGVIGLEFSLGVIVPSLFWSLGSLSEEGVPSLIGEVTSQEEDAIPGEIGIGG